MSNPYQQVLTYYSFVTLTTVGYGDVTPVSPMTRTFAWIEAITGQFYLAIIVAGLVSVLASKHGQPSRHDRLSERVRGKCPESCRARHSPASKTRQSSLRLCGARA